MIFVGDTKNDNEDWMTSVCSIVVRNNSLMVDEYEGE